MLSKKTSATYEFDTWLFLIALIIAIFSVFVVYSATHSSADKFKSLWIKQLIRTVIGVLIFGIAVSINYKILYDFAYFIYISGLVLLILVDIIGATFTRAQRWLALGPLNLQPSEIAKIIYVIAMARYLTDRKYRVDNLRVFLGGLGLSVTYILLIFKQPDLGTSMILVPIMLSMFYVGGVNKLYILMLIIPGLLSATSLIYVLDKGLKFKVEQMLAICGGIAFISAMAYLVVNQFRVTLTKKVIFFVTASLLAGLFLSFIGSSILKDYQKERLMTFLDPKREPLDSGYQIIQAKIAIGSGGFLGQGYLKGRQNSLDFLPERHTDFIFSVVGEEWGFIGSIVLIALYLAMAIRGLKIAATVDDLFGILLAVGIVTMIASQAFINIGMTLGLMPVTGLPLPLMSFGGSSLITTLAAIGLLINVKLQR